MQKYKRLIIRNSNFCAFTFHLATINIFPMQVELAIGDSAPLDDFLQALMTSSYIKQFS